MRNQHQNIDKRFCRHLLYWFFSPVPICVVKTVDLHWQNTRIHNVNPILCTQTTAKSEQGLTYDIYGESIALDRRRDDRNWNQLQTLVFILPWRVSVVFWTQFIVFKNVMVKNSNNPHDDSGTSAVTV